MGRWHFSLLDACARLELVFAAARLDLDPRDFVPVH